MSLIASWSKSNKSGYTSKRLTNAGAHLSTSAPLHNTQEDMVVDMGESFGHAVLEVDAMHQIDRSIFEYYEKRRGNLIPQNEEEIWGYEDPQQHRVTRDRHENTYVAQSFYEVNWGQGFRHRGLDTEYESCPLQGPKGETLEDVVGIEVATSPEARRRWRAIDKGIKDGLDQYDSGPRISCDEDDDILGDTEVDNNIDPPSEEQQQAPMTELSDMQISLQDIAARAFHILGNTKVGSLRKTQGKANLNPTGGIRSVFVQTSHEDPLKQLRTPWDPCPKSSSVKRIGENRVWASLDGPGDGNSYGWLGAQGNEELRGLKRLHA